MPITKVVINPIVTFTNIFCENDCIGRLWNIFSSFPIRLSRRKRVYKHSIEKYLETSLFILYDLHRTSEFLFQRISTVRFLRWDFCELKEIKMFVTEAFCDKKVFRQKTAFLKKVKWANLKNRARLVSKPAPPATSVLIGAQFAQAWLLLRSNEQAMKNTVQKKKWHRWKGVHY